MKKISINKNTMNSLVPAIVTATVMATLLMSVAMADTAAGLDITKVINSATSKIYDIIAGVVGGIGIVILGISAVKYFAGDTREAEEAKKKGFRCVVGSVLVFVLPYLFDALQTWASTLNIK